MIDELKVKNAAILYHLSPVRGSEDLSESKALILSGVHESISSSSLYIDAFNHQLQSILQQQPFYSNIQLGDEASDGHKERVKAKYEHFEMIYKLLVDCNKNEIGIADLMRLAGYTKGEQFVYKDGNTKRQPTKYYMGCRSRMKKIDDQATGQIINCDYHDNNNDNRRTLPQTIYTDMAHNQQSSLTPVSTITNDLSVTSVAADKTNNDNNSNNASTKSYFSNNVSTIGLSQSNNQHRDVQFFPAISPSCVTDKNSNDDGGDDPLKDLPRLFNSSGSGSSSSNNDESDVLALFTGTTKRNTTAQANFVRTVNENKNNIKKSAFKVATIIAESVRQKHNQLKKFDSAVKVAEEVNVLFGFQDCVTSAQITKALRDNRIGVSPPRVGNPGNIPYEDVKDFALLIESMTAIQQYNCEKRWKQNLIVSKLHGVVNAKLQAEGKCLNDPWQFYERIKRINSPRQSSSSNPSQRETRRIEWLTKYNGKKHYAKWAQVLVEKGFARWPENDEEKRKHGKVVFYPGQENNIVWFDEIQLALDGNDQSTGGRASETPTSTEVNDAGEPINKSSNAATLMLGATANDEAFVPLIIYPTSAKSKKNFKISAKRLKNFKQIRAQYGFSSPQWHDVSIAMSPKGSMNNEIFRDWFLNELLGCWPEVVDAPRKRFMLKTDSGPGKKGVETISRSYVAGAYNFLGLPNGTEAIQEMDQIFGQFKTALYKNRDNLFYFRQKSDGNSAKLTLEDIGLILFGGEVTTPPSEDYPYGEKLFLKDVFEEKLSQEHLRSARMKCGFVPVTEEGLNDPFFRDEIYEGDKEEVDDGVDALDRKINEIALDFEQDNQRMVQRLKEKGYVNADVFQCVLNRVSKKQQDAREAVVTLPHTKERQDALARHVHSGEFFHLTDGSDVVNCKDMLLGLERKEMKQAATKLAKMKTARQDAAKIDEIFQALPPYFDKNKKKVWKKNHYIDAIKRYHGDKNPPQGETNLQPKQVGALRNIFERNYMRKQPPKLKPWTDRMDVKLKRLEDGEITRAEETVLYARARKTNNEFLAMRLLNVSACTRAEVFSTLSSKLDYNAKKYLSDILLGNEQYSNPEDFEDRFLITSDDELTITDEDNADTGLKSSDKSDDSDSCSNVSNSTTAFAELNGNSTLQVERSDSDSFNSEDLPDDNESSIEDMDSEKSEGYEASEDNMDVGGSDDDTNEEDLKSTSSIDFEEDLKEEYTNLFEKKNESKRQEEIERQLKKVRTDLNGRKTTMNFYYAAILSKGHLPPCKATKGNMMELKSKYNEVKDEDNFVRTVFFTDLDEENLNRLYSTLHPDE